MLLVFCVQIEFLKGKIKMKSIELVCKVGSTALLNKKKTRIDRDVFKNIASSMTSSGVLVTSGAVEMGKLDVLRKGKDLAEFTKADLASGGHDLVLAEYRKHFHKGLFVKGLLIEHWHFNDIERRKELEKFILRGLCQESITVINYNDALDNEELRKMEIADIQARRREVFDGTDNDETAVSVAKLVKAKVLLLLTQLGGIRKNKDDEKTHIHEICGRTVEETIAKIKQAQSFCNGASREGAFGAAAKLEYIIDAVQNGIDVFIGDARNDIKDTISGRAKSTRIAVEK